MRAPLPGRRHDEAGDETALVGRVRDGDSEALAVVFHSHYDRLCRFAQRYTASDAAAEDIVQDVFLDLWRHRERWLVRGSVRAYLYAAVRNRALNVRKRDAVELRGQVFADAADAITGRALAADAALHTAELDGALMRAVAALPEIYRTVFELRVWHHLTHAEIAHALGLPVKTVETRAARALKVLRVMLGPLLAGVLVAVR